MSEENNSQAAESAVLAEVESIFTGLTPEQIIKNDIAVCKTSREARKVAQHVTFSALQMSMGVAGMSEEQKHQRMQNTRDRLLLAVEAFDKAISLSNWKKDEKDV